MAVAYTGAFLWGVSGMIFGVVSVTTMQRLIAPEAHGRVFALDSAVGSIAEVIGLAIAGPAIAVLGVRPGALALAALPIAAGLATAAPLATSLRQDA